MNVPRRSASLGCITLIAVFFVSLTAFGLAYQAKPSYKVEVGSRLDEPYLAGFEPKEPAEQQRGKDWDGFDYRFSRATSKIDLAGLGSQSLTVTLRVAPSLNPTPSLKVFVNEKNQVPSQYLHLEPGQGLTELSFLVPPSWFADGNLHLKLVSGLWRPSEVVSGSKDNRKLGILVDWVKVEPNNTAATNLVRPPDDIFIPLVICTLLVLLIFLAIGFSSLQALLGSCAVVAGVSIWLVFDRLNLTELVSRDLVRTLFFTWVGVYLAAEFGPKIFRTFGIPVTRRESGWLSAILLFQFLMLWGFMLHPQFTSSDLGLNIHLLESTQSGSLLFPQPLPNNQLAPYPPAYYVLLLPFTNFTDGSDAGIGTLIKVASSILQASEIYFVFYLSSLLRRPSRRLLASQWSGYKYFRYEWEEGINWAGIMAAAFYTISKYTYYIFSQGNHTNLFGVWALLCFICVTAGTLSYLRDLKILKSANPNLEISKTKPQLAAAGRVIETNITTGIYGEERAIYSGAAFGETAEVGPSLSQRYLSWFMSRFKTFIWPVAAVMIRYLLPLALLVLVFLAHYGTFLFANLFMIIFLISIGLLGGRAGRGEVLYLGFCYISALLISFLLYYIHFTALMTAPGNKTGSTVFPPLINIILWFWNSLINEFGIFVVLGGIAGLGLRFSTRGSVKKSWRTISPVSAALLALVVSVIIFGGLSYILKLENRYQLYLLPLVSLAAGAFMGRIWRTGWGGVLVVSTVFLFQFLQVLTFWLDRMTYYF